MDFHSSDYERKVYTALLGKIIGVYFGRPLEGWTADAIREKFGFIDRYVASERGVPLIVTDDDISGTLTFIRALADSGKFENTDDCFFGDTWLNYLIEKETVLWWGGMGRSTEHTAFLRLKHGIRSPESGSMKRNGKIVSEQIGAQIFIDAYGMVAPDDPALAVHLAEKSARVSHDGEAVNGAKVVAAMVSAAFECNDMDKLLDIGVSMIPADSLIAQVHRDVRTWAKEDQDWRKTYDRIRGKYGYDRYDGGCHMIPNHALMVMAWAYAKNNFRQALSIVTSAGWDTDCNAANVGTVTALAAGLDHLCDDYDFLSPVSDRIFIPTAEGTHAASDALNEAYMIASIGRKIMKAPERPALPYFHFSQPYSRQGFMPDDGAADKIRLTNRGGCLEISATAPGRVSRFLRIPAETGQIYHAKGTPLFYPGMGVTIDADVSDLSAVSAVFDIRRDTNDALPVETVICSLKKDADGKFFCKPVCGSSELILSMGFAFTAPAEMKIHSIQPVGKAELDMPVMVSDVGWLMNLDSRWGGSFGKNEGRGILVTGNRFWKDVAFECDFAVHAADRCGLILRYQGLERQYLLIFEQGRAELVRREYGHEAVLAEAAFGPVPDKKFSISFEAKGSRLTALFEGITLHAEDTAFADGGCGFYTEMGVINVNRIHICAATEF